MGDFLTHPRVERELLEIWQFIAKDNPDAATRVIMAAEDTFRLLAENPGLGRTRHFRRKAYRTVRSFPVTGFKNYLILYREITGGVEILHTCHAARDLESLIRKK